MHRISITTIDNYINWYDEEDEYALDKFIAFLQKKDPPNNAMKFGTAFHAIVQTPELFEKNEYGYIYPYEHIGDYDKSLIENDIYTISRNGIDILVENIIIPYHIALPGIEALSELRSHCVFEVRVEEEFKTIDNDIVKLTGIADGIYGNSVIEIKTTGSYSASKYFNSVQWKYYLHMLDLPRAFYMIFELNTKSLGSVLGDINKGSSLYGKNEILNYYNSLVEKVRSEAIIRAQNEAYEINIAYGENTLFGQLPKTDVISNESIKEIEKKEITYIKEIHTMEMSTYSTLSTDISRYTNYFWDFIKMNNLESYLPTKSRLDS